MNKRSAVWPLSPMPGRSAGIGRAVALVLCLGIGACGGGQDDAGPEVAAETTVSRTVTSGSDPADRSRSDSSSTTASSNNSNRTTTTITTGAVLSVKGTERTDGDAGVDDDRAAAVGTAPSTEVPSTSGPSTSAPAVAKASGTTVESTAVAAVGGRPPPGQSFKPFAGFDGVVLVHPSDRVERIGFHQSNNDGARQFEPTADAVAPLVLESRDRGTGSRTAADIVVEPGTEIRAPVTGTVVRAGGYILYCDHRDDFAVIEPDARPGWEVKILHIDGVTVSAGDRVEAGVTVLAPQATVLPFDSQVDEFTAEPSWPHVHVELVDPSIPDRPSTGGGC